MFVAWSSRLQKHTLPKLQALIEKEEESTTENHMIWCYCLIFISQIERLNMWCCQNSPCHRLLLPVFLMRLQHLLYLAPYLQLPGKTMGIIYFNSRKCVRSIACIKSLDCLSRLQKIIRLFRVELGTRVVSC